MSVVIKGFDVPYCCELCNLSTYTDKKCDVLYCYATGHEIEHPTNQRDSNCPLIELPKQHGDLIDKNLLLEVMGEMYSHDDWCYQYVKRARAVIKAEDGE